MRKPTLNAIQYELLSTAILKHKSLVSEQGDKRVIKACQRHGWLSAETVKTDAASAWFALPKAGLDAVLDYQGLHMYQAADNNIAMHLSWQVHVYEHKLMDLGIVTWKEWLEEATVGWDELLG
jgi:6-phosphogluconate dehydrogenase